VQRNAAICVAEISPNTFFDYNAYLFANQPQEGSAGPENAKLYDDAVALNASNLDQIEELHRQQLLWQAGWPTTPRA
jgi:hypothetical protein